LVSIQQTFPEKCIVLFPNKVICDLEDSNIGEKRSNEEFYKKFKWIDN